MKRFAQLGPGLMMAATAVGVSHLVQATRAGASHGLTLTFVVVAIVLLKYPAYRFAAQYASVTGESLVDAYLRMGRAATLWLVLTMLIELFVGTSVLSLVTAGMLAGALRLPFDANALAIVVATASAAILFKGRYLRAERLVRVLVIAFCLVTILMTAIAVTGWLPGKSDLAAPIEADADTVNFIVGMTGYMPLPLSIAIFHSIWVREKRALGDYPPQQAIFDLNVGWIATAILALCFVIVGTAVLYGTGQALPASATAFAAMLFDAFQELTGTWIGPLLAVGGIAVIWSTLVAVLDAVPRIMDRLWRAARGNLSEDRNRYPWFLAVQVAGASVVLLAFRREFVYFVDVAAGLTFLIAPAVAYYNRQALRLPEYRDSRALSRPLAVWNALSIGCFILFAAAFLWLRVTSPG